MDVQLGSRHQPRMKIGGFDRAQFLLSLSLLDHLPPTSTSLFILRQSHEKLKKKWVCNGSKITGRPCPVNDGDIAQPNQMVQFAAFLTC